MPSRLSRRRFLKAAGATAGAFAWLSISRRVLGANERLNVACVGVGERGEEDLKGVVSENIVAMADVDDKFMAKAASDHAPNARQFTDYRKMLDAVGKEVDAVVVATPDHSHAYAGLWAMRMGKHLYCEKPLAHNVHEARLMREEAKRRKLVTQMGTQIHAGDNYRRVVELVKAGAIGPVREVHAFANAKYAPGELPKERPAAPENLHWDLWLGPAPERPYSPEYHPFKWRGWWAFGGGTMSDFGCHMMDVAHWALELGAPQTVEAEGPPVHPESTPTWMIARYHYPARGEQPPVDLTWYSTERRWPKFPQLGDQPMPDWGNVLFVGDKGLLLTNYDRHALLPEKDFKGYKAPEPSIAKSAGHHREWIEACKTGGTTTCNFDYSGALAEAVLLGNVAYRSGKKFTWDSTKLKAVDCPEAAQYVTREYRKGWEL
jgi:predicted dehydrogenase